MQPSTSGRSLGVRGQRFAASAPRVHTRLSRRTLVPHATSQVTKTAEKLGAESTSPSKGAIVADKRRTALQKHVDFFDHDKDGVIWPGDTYIGFRRIGFNIPLSLASTMVIHTSFSYPSYDSWIFDPRFPIYTDKIHNAKHGSDSEVYDTEGNASEEKMTWLLNKYDRGNKGGLNWDDIALMTKQNRNVNDPFGWTAEFLEWWALYQVAKDDNGFVSADKIRAQFDGSLWEQLASEREAKKAAQQRR